MLRNHPPFSPSDHVVTSGGALREDPAEDDRADDDAAEGDPP
jgi:hypothetical protein